MRLKDTHVGSPILSDALVARTDQKAPTPIHIRHAVEDVLDQGTPGRIGIHPDYYLGALTEMLRAKGVLDDADVNALLHPYYTVVA